MNEDYIIFLQGFLTSAEGENLALGAASEIDIALVRYVNRQYLLGHLPHVVEKTHAALMQGHGFLPRSFRALAGWRKKCPARSCSAMPWAFWTAVACHLAQRGHALTAVLTLFLVHA